MQNCSKQQEYKAKYLGTKKLLLSNKTKFYEHFWNKLDFSDELDFNRLMFWIFIFIFIRISLKEGYILFGELYISHTESSNFKYII